ncbi:condensation domain-containing protein [Pseudomonas aeruginosa]|uniref:condensation domain-containing protein n=2 Tax=Pseudomonas aeruginosa TaxID=287 RepID=UPI00391F2F10
MKRSFAALVERHEGLRTTFRQEGGETLQVVHDRLPLEIREQSLGVADEAALMARIEEEVRVPFDLERGPLLRVLTGAGGDPAPHCLRWLVDADHGGRAYAVLRRLP